MGETWCVMAWAAGNIWPGSKRSLIGWNFSPWIYSSRLGKKATRRTALAGYVRWVTQRAPCVYYPLVMMMALKGSPQESHVLNLLLISQQETPYICPFTYNCRMTLATSAVLCALWIYLREPRNHLYHNLARSTETSPFVLAFPTLYILALLQRKYKKAKGKWALMKIQR